MLGGNIMIQAGGLPYTIISITNEISLNEHAHRNDMNM